MVCFRHNRPKYRTPFLSVASIFAPWSNNRLVVKLQPQNADWISGVRRSSHLQIYKIVASLPENCLQSQERCMLKKWFQRTFFPTSWYQLLGELRFVSFYRCLLQNIVGETGLKYNFLIKQMVKFSRFVSFTCCRQQLLDPTDILWLQDDRAKQKNANNFGGKSRLCELTLGRLPTTPEHIQDHHFCAWKNFN